MVDAYSRSVSVPSVWAVGDVTNRIPLTPVARMEGMLLAQHLFKCALLSWAPVHASTGTSSQAAH